MEGEGKEREREMRESVGSACKCLQLAEAGPDTSWELGSNPYLEGSSQSTSQGIFTASAEPSLLESWRENLGPNGTLVL